jgi:uncharacterized membrane protein
MYLILILIGGLLIRLVSLNQSLWLDEGTTALVSRMSLEDIFTKFLPGDFHPPLYYLLLKCWTLVFGSSEISLRIPSIIFGLATVYVTYLIAKKIFDKKVGYIAALLLATSGLSIYYSQEARMYSMTSFLVALSVYLFLENKFLLLSICLALIGMTDYVSLLVLPVFWIFGFRKKNFVFAHIPLILTFVVWSSIFIRQLLGGLAIKSESFGWWKILGTVTYKNIVLIPVKFIIGRISFDDKFIYGAVLLIIFLIFGYVLLKSLKYSKFVWSWLIIPIVLGIFVGFKIPTLSYFRFLFCLPALYILLARGLLEVKDNIRKIVFFAIISINLLSSCYYLLSPNFHRENWRGLVSFVESNKTTNSMTIFVADSNTEAYRYYAPNAKIAGPDGLKTGYSQIWLMRYLKDIFDTNDSVRKKAENLGYKLNGQYNFNGVEVWEYIK